MLMGTDNILFQNILKVIQGYLKYFWLTRQVTCVSIIIMVCVWGWVGVCVCCPSILSGMVRPTLLKLGGFV